MDTLLAQMPLRFELNVGQFAEPIEFLCRGNGYELTATNQQVVVKLEKAKERKWKGSEEVVGDCERLKLPPSAFCLAPSSSNIESRSTTSREATTEVESPLPAVGQTPAALASSSNKTTTLRLKFMGSKATAKVAGLDALATKSNYFIGNHPKDWHTGVANYASLKYTGLYDGVDAVIYGNQQNPEYDFIIAPEADSKVIGLAFEGAKSIKIEVQGDLLLQTEAGLLRQRKPFAYQTINGQRTEIACNYKRLNPKPSQTPKQKRLRTPDACTGARPCAPAQTPLIGFELGDYDKTLPLVIDPILDFSTFAGGGSNPSFIGSDIAVDAQENIYIVGHSNIQPIATPGSGGAQTQETTASAGVFVAKIDSVNKRLVYLTTLRGSAANSSGGGFYQSEAIAVDAADNIYITGSTTDSAFPTTTGAFQPTLKGNRNAFVVKLNPEGSGLLYSTFLGATDAAATEPFPACGNACHTQAFDIAVDEAGNAYLTGETDTKNFPVTPNAFKPGKSAADCTRTTNGNFLGCKEAFVCKLNPQGTALVYSTFLGGSGDDAGNGIAVDKSGNAYVVGTTQAPDFPVTNGLYANFQGGPGDAFLAKLNPQGSALLSSSYLGGSGNDAGTAIDLDSAGNIYLSGDTTSADLPVTANALQKERDTPVLVKSTDGGASWQSLYKGLATARPDLIAVDPHNSSSVFLQYKNEVFKSTDGGGSWKPTSETPKFREHFALAAQDPSVMLAAESSRQQNDTLVRSTDGGATWTKISYPPPNSEFYHITATHIDPNNLSTLYIAIFTSTNPSFLKTTDAGGSWKPINTGLPAPNFKTLLGINPRNPNLLFAQANQVSQDTNGIFRSANGGDRWRPAALDGKLVEHISFAPSNPATVYANGKGLFRSTDDGVNWTAVESTLCAFEQIIVAPANPLLLYADLSGRQLWGFGHRDCH